MGEALLPILPKKRGWLDDGATLKQMRMTWEHMGTYFPYLPFRIFLCLENKKKSGHPHGRGRNRCETLYHPQIEIWIRSKNPPNLGRWVYQINLLWQSIHKFMTTFSGKNPSSNLFGDLQQDAENDNYSLSILQPMAYGYQSHLRKRSNMMPCNFGSSENGVFLNLMADHHVFP